MHKDLQYGLRMLLRSPAYTAVAVLSLALGIGVNISIFSFVDAILFRPLPVRDPGRLVAVYNTNRSSGTYSSNDYPDYEYYRDNNQVFSGLMAYVRVPFLMRLNNLTESVPGEIVTPNYFSVLGIEPVAGRAFGAATVPEAVISYGFWQRRFGGDPGVLGRSLTLGGSSFTIVGVAPKSFHGTVLDWSVPPDIWVPYAFHHQAVPVLVDHGRGMHWLLAMGRLKPGVTLEQARADFSTMGGRLARDYPKTNADWLPKLLPSSQARFWPAYRTGIINFLGLLGAVVGAVLLIACFNVANLMLGRASQRAKEMAVRLALGATRARLARQLLTEALLAAVLGGAAGLLVASWTSSLLAGFYRPFRIPLAIETGLEPRTLVFALALSLLTAVLCGIMPALRMSDANLSAGLKSRFGLKNALVAGQVALSLLLLIGAGLFVRTLRNAQSSDVTMLARNVLLVEVDLAGAGYTVERSQAFFPRMLERVRAVPGVQSAGLVYLVPHGGMRGGTNILVDGPPVQVDFNVVSPGYFETIGIPVVRGRDFHGRDRDAVIINEVMARRFWPGEDPIGKRFRLEREKALVEVAGVVRDGKFRGYRAEIKPCFYRPLAGSSNRLMTLEVRTAGNPLAFMGAVRAALQSMDKDLPVPEFRTWGEHLNRSLSQERMTAALVSALGLLALALAAVGLYGVMSFAVAQRTREVGIRMALGASRGAVVRMILGRGMLLTAMGAAIGTIAAVVLTRLVSNLLYGVSATNFATFLGAALVIGIVAAAASYIPARRAAGVDPVEALRYE